MANPSVAGATADSSESVRASQRAALEAVAARGARWFYIVAALSVVNSVFMFSGTNTRFVVGLGITDEVVRELSSGGNGVAMAVTLAIAGVFALFGYFASKLQNWSFVSGIVLYTLDALVLLIYRDFMSTAFHGLALFYIFRGFSAARQAASMRPANSPLG